MPVMVVKRANYHGVGTYIIIVGVTHGKACVHLISTASAVANVVAEGVTASPMAATAPGVAVHGIT